MKNNINQNFEVSLYENIEYRIEKRQNNFDQLNNMKMDMLMIIMK